MGKNSSNLADLEHALLVGKSLPSFLLCTMPSLGMLFLLSYSWILSKSRRSRAFLMSKSCQKHVLLTFSTRILSITFRAKKVPYLQNMSLIDYGQILELQQSMPVLTTYLLYIWTQGKSCRARFPHNCIDKRTVHLDSALMYQHC